MTNIYADILVIYCDIIFSCCLIQEWVLPVGFLPRRVWVWDKIYTQVQVWMRVVGKILRHEYGFG
jgi:hypothetical protein